MPNNKDVKTLRLYIPDTIVFLEGEVKFLVLTGDKNKNLVYNKQKEFLNLNELRKFMN